MSYTEIILDMGYEFCSSMYKELKEHFRRAKLVDANEIISVDIKKLKIGDHIFIQRIHLSGIIPGYTHHGIVTNIKNDIIYVTHPYEENGKGMKGKFIETTLDKFINKESNEYETYVVELVKYNSSNRDFLTKRAGSCYPFKKLEVEDILKNVIDMKKDDYSIIEFNCEDFAVKCCTGTQNRSEQIKRLLTCYDADMVAAILKD